MMYIDTSLPARCQALRWAVEWEGIIIIMRSKVVNSASQNDRLRYMVKWWRCGATLPCYASSSNGGCVEELGGGGRHVTKDTDRGVITYTIIRLRDATQVYLPLILLLSILAIEKSCFLRFSNLLTWRHSHSYLWICSDVPNMLNISIYKRAFYHTKVLYTWVIYRIDGWWWIDETQD